MPCTHTHPGRTRTHPGEVLRQEFMPPFGLSANALALALRVPATRIGAIIREDRPRAVTADTALRLARYFGTTPEFWLNLQSAYDLAGPSPRSARGSSATYDRGRPDPLRQAGLAPLDASTWRATISFTATNAGVNPGSVGGAPPPNDGAERREG